jgi:DNA polymerase I-like protein with 3'-5' exonuclease and polymerase domains
MADITEAPHVWPSLKGEGHIIAVDTETTGLHADDPCQRKDCGPHCPGNVHITTVTLASDGWSLGIPFDVREAENAEAEDWYSLCFWLKKQKLIFHNAKFDVEMFYRGAPMGWNGVDLTDNIMWDTKLACWVLWPLESSSLKATAMRLWGFAEGQEQRDIQQWLKDHDHEEFEIWYAPMSVHMPYAKQDAVLTYDLWKEQEMVVGRDEDYELSSLIEREVEVCKVLIGMETRGIGFDVDKAKEIDRLLRAEKETLTQQLPFRPTDMQAVKFWQKNDPDNPVWVRAKRTPTGRVSTDKDAMPTLIEAGLPFAEEYDHWSDLDLAISRYYGDRDEYTKKGRSATWRKLVGKDGRLRTDFQQDGTTSTRFSARRVNLQAIPKEETAKDRYPSPRSCMVAQKGYVLVEMDLSQAEVRVAAAVSQSKGLRSVVNSGDNIHLGTARLLFPHLDWTGTEEEQKKRNAKEYHAAKTLNFAIQYGAGPDKIAGMLHCTVGEAEAYRSRYHSAFPEIQQTMRIAQHKAETRGYVYLISGRKRYFAPEERSFKALNAVVQGNVAEAMKEVMLWINKFYPTYMLIQIHDSLVMEIPDTTEAWKNIEDILRHTEEMLTEMFGIKMAADLKIWTRKEVTV